MKKILVVCSFIVLHSSFGQVPNEMVGDSILTFPDQYFYSDTYEDTIQKVIDSYHLNLQWDSLSNFYFFSLKLDKAVYQLVHKEEYSQAISTVTFVLRETNEPGIKARAIQTLSLIYSHLDLKEKAIEVLESNQSTFLESGIEGIPFDYHHSLGVYNWSLARRERGVTSHVEKALYHFEEALKYNDQTSEELVQVLLSSYHGLLIDFDLLEDPSVLYRTPYMSPNLEASPVIMFDANNNLAHYYLKANELDSAAKYVAILDSLFSLTPTSISSRKKSQFNFTKSLYLLQSGDPGGTASFREWLHTRDSLMYKEKVRLNEKLLATAEDELKDEESSSIFPWKPSLMVHLTIDVVALLILISLYFFFRYKKTLGQRFLVSGKGDTSNIILTEYPEQAEIKYMEVLKRLDQKYPDLTKNDRRTWVYIYEGFTYKETAKLRGVSVRAVESAIYRLFKKTGLSSTQGLRDEFEKARTE